MADPQQARHGRLRRGRWLVVAGAVALTLTAGCAADATDTDASSSPGPSAGAGRSDPGPTVGPVPTPTPTPTPGPTPTPIDGAVAGGPTRPDDAEGPYPVVDVVDGDTLKVEIDGETVTVRVIGIDTPETRDPRKPVQCFGREASAMADALLADQQVRLSTDPTQDRYDRYDRLLAHVWLPDGRSFEWVMVAEGFAHEYTYDLPYTYQGDYQDAERLARAAGRGLWAPDTCSGDTTAAAE